MGAGDTEQEQRQQQPGLVIPALPTSATGLLAARQPVHSAIPTRSSLQKSPRKRKVQPPLAPGGVRSPAGSSGEERTAVRLRGVERRLRLSAGTAQGTTQRLEARF